MNLNPLDPKNIGARLLTDRGIKKAIELDLIKITPEISENQIQPASLDLKVKEFWMDEPYKDIDKYEMGKTMKVKNSSKYDVIYNQIVDIGSSFNFYNYESSNFYLDFACVAKSSIRRLGCIIPNHRLFFEDNKHSTTNISNLSPNDIIFKEDEAISQVLFFVNPWPFDEQYSVNFQDKPEFENGKKIRSLDMGIKIVEKEKFNYLYEKEFSSKKELKFQDESILVHASERAYRLKKIGDVEFSERKKLNDADILEPVDISKGYEIKPFEHLIIETEEDFSLSEKIGIFFMDNPVTKVINFKKGELNEKNKYGYRFNREEAVLNTDLIPSFDGWVDPGYKGGFTRQPKWLTEGRIVKPGMVVGYGQIFYFPNGVERTYGSKGLGSHYQKKEKMTF